MEDYVIASLPRRSTRSCANYPDAASMIGTLRCEIEATTRATHDRASLYGGDGEAR